jgi:hypothetical protein
VRAAAAAMLVALVLACATTGAPAQYRFTGMRQPAAALACAIATLDQEGFELLESSPDQGTAVLAHPPRPTLDRPREWWRVEITVTTDADGVTVVTSLAGATPRADGPLGAPPAELQHIVGMLASRCTW